MKIRYFYICFICIFSIFLFSNKFSSKKSSHFEEMILAKKKTELLFDEIIKEKNKRGIDTTSLIGEEFTGITTTLGDFDSKKLSTNPDFSAYFIKILKDNSIKKNDYIAINLSSSFPALNISLLSALDTLEVNGITINSIGSSMYGANNENFTFLEMIMHLNEKKLLKNSITAYSLGGDFDLGKNFDEETKFNILNRIKKYNLKKIYIGDLNKNIQNRIEIYERSGEIKAFINIGGNLVHEKLENYFTKIGTPTFNILNIKKLSTSIGLSKTNSLSDFFYKKNLIPHIFILLIFIYFLIIIKKQSKE